MQAITERLDAVETLTEEILLRNNIREALRQIYDLERLTGRVACGNANGRDLIALRNSIRVIPEIKAELQQCGDFLLERLEKEMSDLIPICVDDRKSNRRRTALYDKRRRPDT